MPAPTRLFVGNLPFGVSEGDLSEEFASYGAVKSVELKRKKVTDSESNSLFAFITIESDIQNINKCIQEFSEQKWKGCFLNVTVARESFMEKLKREREEEGRKKENQTLTPAVVPTDKISEESTRNPVPLPAFKFVPKPVPVNNYTNGDSKFEQKPKYVPEFDDNKFEHSETKFENINSKFVPKSKYVPEFDDEYGQYSKSKYVPEYNQNDEYDHPNNQNSSEFHNGFVHSKHKHSQEVKEPFQRKFTEVQHDYSMKKKGKVEPMAPFVKQKIKIASVVPLSEQTKPKEAKKLTAADEKRLQSIQNMKAAYNDKKSAIKIALSSVDKKVKKILFDEDGTQIIPKESLTKDSNKTNANLPGKKANKRKRKDGTATVDYNTSAANGANKNKKALFDETGSADEDDGINFDIKEQFEGESGQKLMQLQARFQSDKRFTMDERFMEEVDGAEDGVAADEEQVDGVEDEERLRQMDILQGILGRTVRTSGKFPTKEGDVNKKQVLLKTMLRFDPNRPDHDHFMSKPSDGLPAKKSKKQRKKEREEALTEQADEKAAPEVSQERYYKVNESLKQSLDEQKPFSLLSLFGNREPEDDTAPAEYSAISIKKSTDKYQNPLTESNPFVYDSSDNEETTKKETGEQVEESPYGIATPKALLVTENFFFSSTDPRFKEGLHFFMNIKPQSDKTRDELKFLVKRRIRNNMRNERFDIKNFKKFQQRHSAKTTKFRRK